MKASELRSKSEQELRDELLGLYREQFNLRMQRGVNPQAVNSSQFTVVRRSIARVKTIMTENSKSGKES